MSSPSPAKGQKRRRMHPNSLAQLKPGVAGVETRFTPETAPKGRKSAGLSALEHVNRMCGWTDEQLEQSAADKSLPRLERNAAKKILDEREFWNIVHNTHGLPKQPIETITPPATKQIDLGELAEKFAAMGWAPETMPDMLRAALEQRRAGVPKVVESKVVEPGEKRDAEGT